MPSTTRVQFNVSDRKLADLDEMQAKLGLSTRKDLFDNAMTLLRWAVRKKEEGLTIAAVDGNNPHRELEMPALQHIRESRFEKRVFKVAQEIGASTDRIIQFLEQEGYGDAVTGSGFNASIIDEEAYLALQHEYAKEPESDTHENADGRSREGDDQLDDASKKLIDYLENMHVSLRSKAVDRYLGVLSKVCQQKPDRFEEVKAKITGDTRRYFGETKEKLASSGTGVNPKQIPDTPYYAATGNRTETKKERIEAVLKLLDYDERAIQKACNIIDS